MASLQNVRKKIRYIEPSTKLNKQNWTSVEKHVGPEGTRPQKCDNEMNVDT